MPTTLRNSNVSDRDPDDDPMATFAAMVIAQNRGQFRRAAEAQDQLARLGWKCQFCSPDLDRKGVAK